MASLVQERPGASEAACISIDQVVAADTCEQAEPRDLSSLALKSMQKNGPTDAPPDEKLLININAAEMLNINKMLQKKPELRS